MRIERRLTEVLIHVSLDEARELAADVETSAAFEAIHDALAAAFLCLECGAALGDDRQCEDITCPECPQFVPDDEFDALEPEDDDDE